MPRRIDSFQLSLFPTDLREVAASIGLNWWAAKKLYDDKWLSFDPDIISINNSSQIAEFIFLGTLVSAGCDPRMLNQLLETLEKPYCYDISSIYYDWTSRCWKDIDIPHVTVDEQISELEEMGDIESLKEMRELSQEALSRLNDDDLSSDDYPFNAEDDDDLSSDNYAFNADDDVIVSAARNLLWKIAASSLVDTPAKIIVVGKLFQVFQNLPMVTENQYLGLSLVSPRRKYGNHEIYHFWEILLDDGYLKITSAGHFYRPETGGDSFTSMIWEVTPGCEPDKSDYLYSLSLVDDADTFENEVEAMDFRSGRYSLSVEDPTLEDLEEEEIDQDEDSNGDEASETRDPWSVTPRDDADRKLEALIDHSEVDNHEASFSYGAEFCDFCKCRLSERGLYVDGKVRNDNLWANMCAPCFEKKGDGIGWGVGQIYALQTDGEWRLVAGFEK